MLWNYKRRENVTMIRKITISTRDEPMFFQSQMSCEVKN